MPPLSHCYFGEGRTRKPVSVPTHPATRRAHPSTLSTRQASAEPDPAPICTRTGGHAMAGDEGLWPNDRWLSRRARVPDRPPPPQ